MFSGRDFLLCIVNTEQLLFFLYSVALCGLVSIQAAFLLFTICILHRVVSSLVEGDTKNWNIGCCYSECSKCFTSDCSLGL